jgi:hypothetical protein
VSLLQHLSEPKGEDCYASLETHFISFIRFRTERVRSETSRATRGDNSAGYRKHGSGSRSGTGSSARTASSCSSSEAGSETEKLSTHSRDRTGCPGEGCELRSTSSFKGSRCHSGTGSGSTGPEASHYSFRHGIERRSFR